MAKKCSSNKGSSADKTTKSKRIKLKKIQKMKIQKKSSESLANNATQKHNESLKKKNYSEGEIKIIKGNMNNYAKKLSNMHFNTYSKDIMNDFFEDEPASNRKIISEEILNKYHLSKNDRRSCFTYLLDIASRNNINVKCCFSAMHLFDLFLVSYSEDTENVEKIQNFFNSKITNKLSKTKMMLFILCCFCIVCKYYNTSLLSVEELLNVEHAKDEVDYDDLVDLMETIFVYTEADIDSKNIHYYIELFKFHILEKMEQSTISKKFIQYFEDKTNFFSKRIIQDIEMVGHDSLNAFGIIIFTYELSKYILEERNVELDDYMKQWRESLWQPLEQTKINRLELIYEWLNNYVARH